MKSNNILLADPAFDPASAPTCKLLVKIGLDSLSYAIIDLETNKVSALYDEQECENGTEKFAERLQTDSYLSLPYQEIKVAFHAENTFSIPKDIYNEEDLGVYSKFFTATSSGNIYQQPHDFYGFTNIFSLSPKADGFFSNEIKKYQQSAGLLNLAEKIAGRVLLLDFTVGAVNMLLVNDHQVVLQQCYETEHPEEFNYYLILMIKQLSVDTQNTQVKLMGIIHDGDAKYNCLTKYFNSIEFLSFENGTNLEILEDMPSHYYSTLLALNECE